MGWGGSARGAWPVAVHTLAILVVQFSKARHAIETSVLFLASPSFMNSSFGMSVASEASSSASNTKGARRPLAVAHVSGENEARRRRRHAAPRERHTRLRGKERQVVRDASIFFAREADDTILLVSDCAAKPHEFDKNGNMNAQRRRTSPGYEARTTSPGYDEAP